MPFSLFFLKPKAEKHWTGDKARIVTIGHEPQQQPIQASIIATMTRLQGITLLGYVFDILLISLFGKPNLVQFLEPKFSFDFFTYTVLY